VVGKTVLTYSRVRSSSLLKWLCDTLCYDLLAGLRKKITG